MRSRYAALALSLIGGLHSPACFRAPNDAVLFSCNQEQPACPGGYTCRADGCCHRDGSDYDEHAHECRAANPSGTRDTGTSTGDTGTSTGTETEGSTTTANTTGSSGSETGMTMSSESSASTTTSLSVDGPATSTATG